MDGDAEVNISGNMPIISLSFQDGDNVSTTSISITVSAKSLKDAYKTLDKVVENIISDKLVKVRNKRMK